MKLRDKILTCKYNRGEGVPERREVWKHFWGLGWGIFFFFFQFLLAIDEMKRYEIRTLNNNI